ncbi:MAG: SPOR domain-containing protein, partial [Parvibaculum sp.]|uniref:SPOR domain-containing protein n=1 Tax=Parvibaculum sp. TaxID=2024848 RepID=UPI003C78EDF4
PKPAATAKPAPAQASKAPASAKGAYLVQVAALKDEKSARASWRALSQRFPAVLGGHALDIEKADLGAKGTWYRVRAAGFQTKAAATEACARLKAAGQACMVKKR